MKTGKLHSSIVTVLGLCTWSTLHAGGVDCVGVLGGTQDDVIISSGNTCTLDGAMVRGSVLISGGGNLVALGGTMILGSVQADGGGNVDVLDATVFGDISMNNSGDTTTSAASRTGTIKNLNSGMVSASGDIASIESTESASIAVDGATIFPGGITVSKSNGDLTICGSSVEAVVAVTETTGNVIADAGSCAGSTIDGGLLVEKGTGDVVLIGATLTSGDLSVVEQSGNVSIGAAFVSDVKVEKTSGDVVLTDVTTDSDTTIIEVGNVDIVGAAFGSDVAISLNSAVSITASSISLEDVLISNNSGPVVIDSNCDFSLNLIENQNVTLSNNNEAAAVAAGAVCNNDGFGLTDVEISKNSGGVTVNNNTGELLKCADNSPAPTGSGNNFVFTDGQCSGL